MLIEPTVPPRDAVRRITKSSQDCEPARVIMQIKRNADMHLARVQSEQDRIQQKVKTLRAKHQQKSDTLQELWEQRKLRHQQEVGELELELAGLEDKFEARWAEEEKALQEVLDKQDKRGQEAIAELETELLRQSDLLRNEVRSAEEESNTQAVDLKEVGESMEQELKARMEVKKQAMETSSDAEVRRFRGYREGNEKAAEHLMEEAKIFQQGINFLRETYSRTPRLPRKHPVAVAPVDVNSPYRRKGEKAVVTSRDAANRQTTYTFAVLLGSRASCEEMILLVTLLQLLGSNVQIPLWTFAAPTTGGRQVQSLDGQWRFQREKVTPQVCNATTFPEPLTGHCTGLLKQGRPEDGGPGNATACRAACCAESACNAWQWRPGSCWLGFLDIRSSCTGSGQWQGEGDPSRKPRKMMPGSPCWEDGCRSDLDDSHWRVVDVPHDFVVEGNFTPTADKSHGYLPYGIAWYRRKVCIPEAADIASGKRYAWLEFEGVMVRSQVWLNGVYLGGHGSGYTPFLVDLGVAKLTPDCSNVLAVHADATSPDGWWYDGGGIYRHVWLTVADPVHVAPWGVYAPARVSVPLRGAEANADAEVHPIVAFRNKRNATENLEVTCTVKTSGGAVVASQVSAATAAGNATTEISLRSLQMPGASLWSPAHPALYRLEVSISSTSSQDQVSVTFGVRTVAWDPNKGFVLNGVPTKILGTANHQDFAAVGVAVPDHLQVHRLRKLKEFGANGFRTAHNPHNEALLQAADEEGILVWAENHRNGQDEEMEVMIKRDRNHPSIVIWSICNENLCHSDDVVADAKRLKALAHRLDPLMGRPVSANYNDFNGNHTPMDVMGFDYSPETYDRWHAAAPEVPAISSETSSAYSDRGLVANDPAAGHVRDYDTEHPGWGETSQVAWQAILSRSFVAGGFTWTGWDYRGEPTPYQWPDVNSHFGVLDMAGFWKHRAYYYKACWTPPSTEYILHLLPHWNWEEHRCGDGCRRDAATGAMLVTVWAYSNAEEVELIHPNGTSMGKISASPCSHVSWEVPFLAGQLTAKGYVKGQVVQTAEVHTTGSPQSLRLRIKDGVGESGVIANGQDVALLSVDVLDAQGSIVPTASAMVTFAVEGGARILGTANGDPASLELNTSPQRPAFGGRLMAVLRPTAPASGAIRVTASSPGLTSDSLQLKVLPKAPKAAKHGQLIV
ncbi:unnamed protein product [Symbiodinium natans]|uniref:Beta-galactosidase n=1 Tax=Symbiodinium natans TaxID=878477 RepID=A0A812IBC9_9DINO|nr:unnamed protein product [Symbiodinium natans]